MQHIQVVVRSKKEIHPKALIRKQRRASFHHLQSLSFLKNDETADFG